MLVIWSMRFTFMQFEKLLEYWIALKNYFILNHMVVEKMAASCTNFFTNSEYKLFCKAQLFHLRTF